jgi:tryptophanyl-tRNA synthetase
LTDVYLEHDKLLENMHADNEIEKNQLEQEKIELSEKIERMLKMHKQRREETENSKWEEIESLKEKNKEELADRVDKTM